MPNDDPVFDVQSRDYSKQPATLGEIAGTTAKMIAEPAARTVRNAYRAVRDYDFAFGKPATDK